MTTPPVGVDWEIAYDADSAVTPVTDPGFFDMVPDPAGSVAGGVWTVPTNTTLAIDATGSHLPVGMRTTWAEMRATGPSAGGDPINNCSLQMVVTNYLNYLAFMIVTADEIITIESPLTFITVATGDYTADFHEYLLSVSDDGDQVITVDGVVIDSRAPYDYPEYPFAQLTTSSTGSAEVRGWAAAIATATAPPPDSPLPPALAQFHLGAPGLTIDFDDLAHYDTQLSPTQIQYHNDAGKGIA
jgi:hypothetical protein